MLNENFPLEVLRNYIDWSPFFLTWELKGKYPAIFNNEKYGNEAKKLFDDANILLDKVIKDKSLKALGIFGLFPANSSGDDIEIYSDNSRQGIKTVFHTLRQQGEKSAGVPHLALADFIAPKESKINDYKRQSICLMDTFSPGSIVYTSVEPLSLVITVSLTCALKYPLSL